MKLSLHLPLKTVSESNCFEHWTKKHKRHKEQKNAVHSAFKLNLPAKVTLTRISPKQLDSDNLAGSFKWIRDAVAEEFRPGLAPGRADDHAGFTWVYEQRKGKPKEY